MPNTRKKKKNRKRRGKLERRKSLAKNKVNSHGPLGRACFFRGTAEKKKEREDQNLLSWETSNIGEWKSKSFGDGRHLKMNEGEKTEYYTLKTSYVLEGRRHGLTRIFYRDSTRFRDLLQG